MVTYIAWFAITSRLYLNMNNNDMYFDVFGKNVLLVCFDSIRRQVIVAAVTSAVAAMTVDAFAREGRESTQKPVRPGRHSVVKCAPRIKNDCRFECVRSE